MGQLEGAVRMAGLGINRYRKLLWSFADRSVISKYVAEHDVRRLQFGTGKNPRVGWLNSDLWPNSKGIIRLNAAKPLPLDDGLFDFVFSEHMIEHVSAAAGRHFLGECFRVMRPGGRIRIATPDLAFLLALLSPDHSDVHGEYVRWSTEEFVRKKDPGVDGSHAVVVVNNYVRDWGHQFIYDEATLRAALERAGFVDVVRCELNQSTSADLRDLENEDRMPPGFLRLETMILEGTR